MALKFKQQPQQPEAQLPRNLQFDAPYHLEPTMVGVPGLPPVLPVGVNFNQMMVNKIRHPIAPPPIAMPGANLKRAINYYADYNGCGWWRMISPEMLLNLNQKAIINGLTTMVVDPRFYVGTSCVKLQRQATPIQLEFVRFLKEGSGKLGFKTIYEIDDIIFKDDIPDYNRCKDAFNNEDIFKSSLEMMQMCDEMTVTCEYMKNYYREKTGNKKITVIPNYPPKMWFDRFYDEDKLNRLFNKHKKKPRIGYFGSGTHIDVINRTNQHDDFSHVVDAIIKSRNKYHWVFVGCYPLPVKPFIDMGEMEFIQWSPLLDFPESIARANVNAVYAPLTDCHFNKAKCLTKDTLISTSNGIKYINNINTFDKVWQEFSYESISNIFTYSNQQTIKLTTFRGFEIEGTYNHKLRSNNEFVEMYKFKKNDKLDIGFFEYQNINDYKKIYYPLFWTKRGDKCIFPKTENMPNIIINEDWGRLIGYVMGDGHIASNSISIACSSDYLDVVDDIKRISNSIGIDTKIYSDKERTSLRFSEKKRDVRINSQFLRNIFATEFGFLEKNNQKLLKTPQIIFDSPKSVIREYIKGLFETDGTVNDVCSNCSFTTMSKQLGKEIQFLLMGFGILSNLKETWSKQYKRSYYRLTLCREACDIFYKEIGFVSNLKNEKLKNVVSKTHSNRFKTWEMFDTIVKIEYSNNDVFDIEIPHNHYYNASGIISHNSNIKFLESACIGIPGAFQDLVTYKDAPLKFVNGNDLVDRMDYLLKDESTYMKISKQSRDFANKNWLDDHLDEHLEAYFTPYGSPERTALLRLNPEQKSN